MSNTRLALALALALIGANLAACTANHRTHTKDVVTNTGGNVPAESGTGEAPTTSTSTSTTTTTTTVKTPVASLDPERLDVLAKFVSAGPPIVAEDKGQTISIFQATLRVVEQSQKVNDQIWLERAGSRRIVSPSLGDCKLTQDVFDTLGMTNNLIAFSGTDEAGKSDCQDFFAEVAATGLELEYSDVPLRNLGTVFKRVNVMIVH